MPLRAYYATKLSPNISRMPNGFLVCKNVPIARTGAQDYRGAELGNNERPDELFRVYRDESEVFTPAALASFEGVPLVDEHPSSDVTIENACGLMRGLVKDVRRGSGDDADKVVADIIVTDPIIIAEIENGKREMSCGYKCDFLPDKDGRIFQRNIRGNHVALVGKGRAGQDVAIKDTASEPPQPKTERRTLFMKKPVRNKTGSGLLSKFFGILTSDADPEVVAEIAEQLVEAVEEPTPIDEAPATEKQPEPTPAAVEEKPKDDDGTPAWASAIMERLEKLEAACAPKTPDADSLSDLEKEIGSGEEKVTKPVAEMDESEPTSDEATLDTDDPSDEAPTADEEPASDAAGTTDARDALVRAKARKAIHDAKKQVSKIEDAATRRAVSDAMAGLIRQTYGIKPTTPKGSYAAIVTAKQTNAKHMKDAYPAFDNMASRQAAYDKYNPHKKG